MKKAISVLLAAVLAFTLFSCAGTNGASASASPSAAPSSSAPSSAPSSSAPSSAAPSPSTSGMPDITKDSDFLGYFDDGVDPNSRKTYSFVHMYPMSMQLNLNVTKCLETTQKRLNYTITASTSEGDFDKDLQNIDTYAQQGVDGFIMSIDQTVTTRFTEVLDETGIPWMAWCNSVRDENGVEYYPCVGVDNTIASNATLQWLYDNYKTYWGEIDTSKIALINSLVSTSIDLGTRGRAAEALFNKLIPNNAGVFNIDILNDFTMDGAYNQASATFSAHPDIKYWFSTNCIEQYAQGVTRAAETQGIDKNVLVVDVGHNILTSQWDIDYEGCWVSAYAISDYQQTVPAVCALIAMIEGKATPESLWTEQRAPGDKCTFLIAQGSMLTKDMYKDWFNKTTKAVNELAGLNDPLPYPSK
jgi:ABC-type sugar transport system substrate-binding protein